MKQIMRLRNRIVVDLIEKKREKRREEKRRDWKLSKRLEMTGVFRKKSS
jgi:hypothetical protein